MVISVCVSQCSLVPVYSFISRNTALFTCVLSTMQYRSSSLLCKYPIHIRLLPHFCGNTCSHTLNTALFCTAYAACLDSDTEQHLFLELFVPVSVKVVCLLGQVAFFGTSFWQPHCLPCSWQQQQQTPLLQTAVYHIPKATTI
jgi:hypothetical protein